MSNFANTTVLVVPTGPYWGYNIDQLETERQRLAQQRSELSARLTGSTVNGQNFQFTAIDAQMAALDRQQQDLQAAFYYLDPSRYPVQPPTNNAMVAFQ